jgi:hypothetical protein
MDHVDRMLHRRLRAARGLPSEARLRTGGALLLFAIRFNERFWNKVDLCGGDEDACWLWRGAGDQRGYGKVRVGPFTMKAHRVAWMLVKGEPPPPHKVLDHTCQCRLCVNPAHLEPVTKRENTLRGEGPTAQRHRARLARDDDARR